MRMIACVVRMGVAIAERMPVSLFVGVVRLMPRMLRIEIPNRVVRGPERSVEERQESQDQCQQGHRQAPRKPLDVADSQH